ncbi:MAG TPA: triose-phosphate isomerase, partial [Acidimicrobiales bacterium]
MPDAPRTTAGRRPLISGNWKMNLNHFEATATLDKLRYLVTKDDLAEVEVSVHPPFTDIRTVQTFVESEKVEISLGAQNCHWEDKGAFTGEVSPAFLAKLNVRYVIVGHSERRELFGDTNEWVSKKLHAVLKHGMVPILCVGETLEEREAGGTAEKVTGQVRAGLEGVTPEQVGAMVIAYEPIWAIGTGRAATPADANRVIALSIRAPLADRFGEAVAQAVRVQYGGSVTVDNIAEFMAMPDIDGALVGGASLKPDYVDLV